MYGHFWAGTHLKLLSLDVRIGEIPQSKPTFDTSVPRWHYGSLRTMEGRLEKDLEQMVQVRLFLAKPEAGDYFTLRRLASSKSWKQALLTAVWIRFARRDPEAWSLKSAK